MPNEPIDINIPKTIFPATGVGISQNMAARRPVASSVETANKRLDLPPPTLQILSNILHNTVSAAMALLDVSRPRVLRLARRVSAWTIFVGVFPILMSLLMTEAVAQTSVPAPGPPTGITITPGDRQYTLKWTHPSDISLNDIDAYYLEHYDSALNPTGNSLLWVADHPTVVAANPYYTRTLHVNGIELIFRLRVRRKTSVDPNNIHGAFSSYLRVTPRIPAPTDFTATLDDAAIGDRTVTLSWTAPSPLAVVGGTTQALTDYEYSRNGGTWTSIGLVTSRIETGLENGRSYTFKVRGVRTGDPQNADSKGTASRTVTVRPLIDAPGEPISFDVEIVEDKDTNTAKAILTWNPPSNAEEDTIRYEYRYKSNPWTPWTSTGSSGTTYTVTGLEIGTEYTFEMRAIYVGNDGIYISFPSNSSNSGVLSLPKPKRKIRYECPVGWTRGSVFGNTKKALIYELKVNVDHTHRVSIYELESLAIYVHPDEGLQTLEGWYLTTGILYNHDHENKFHLTAENSVIDEHGFAHIQNPEDTPIRMGTLGFIGQSLPSFDYRLYDEKGLRVDFGISCYKEGGLTFRLWNTKDPRVLRMLPFPVSEAALSVRMKELDWQTPFFRTQWTAAIMPDLPDAPAAPSLVKKNIVGTWADLKKQ